MVLGRDVWIISRLAGLAALGLAGALWIFYMAIAPAAESELESVTGTVVYRTTGGGRRSSSDNYQTLTIRQAHGEETRYSAPIFARTSGGERRRVDIWTGHRVTLKVSDYGNVYAADVRGKTVLEYNGAREHYASRRIIPGIVATSVTLLALVLALLSYFGPMYLDDEPRPAAR